MAPTPWCHNAGVLLYYWQDWSSPLSAAIRAYVQLSPVVMQNQDSSLNLVQVPGVMGFCNVWHTIQQLCLGVVWLGDQNSYDVPTGSNISPLCHLYTPHAGKLDNTISRPHVIPQCDPYNTTSILCVRWLDVSAFCKTNHSHITGLPLYSGGTFNSWGNAPS